MDLSFKPIPLVINSAKFLATPPDSGLVKKRKLSECSDTSVTSSVSDRSSSLNEKFLGLSLENRSKFSGDDAFKLDEELPMHTISIPKAVRPTVARQEEASSEAAPKNENFLENLLKISQNDISGISKYLNLDLGVKMSAWDKIASNSNEAEKFKMGSVFKSFLNSPFGCPFMKPDLLIPTPNTAPNVQGGSNEASKFSYRGNTIGILTQDQRQEKVSKYLEKKKSRQGVKIRYNVRKDLADKRERHQGRFVKTPKALSHSDLIEKSQGKAEKMTLENNSDIVVSKGGRGNLGKRINKSDLFNDSSATDP